MSSVYADLNRSGEWAKWYRLTSRKKLLTNSVQVRNAFIHLRIAHNISHQTQTHECSLIKWQMNEFCADLYLWYSQGLPQQFLQQWFYINNYAVSAIVFIMFERNWIELFKSSIIHKIFKSFSRFGATHSRYQRSSPNDALRLAFSFI